MPRHPLTRVLRALPLVPAFVLLAACGPPGQPAGETVAAPGLLVTTVALESREVDRSLVVSGSVAAWQEMSLGVELTGVRAAEVLVEVGDTVKAGQPLLRLDRRTLEVQARQAEAGVAQARASLELAKANATRGESLVAQGLISSSNADELRAELLKAEAQLATAEADRENARLRLGFATLLAPDAGVISARAVQPGQVVSAGTELLRLIRQGRLEWRAELAERDLTRVSAGTVVELTGPGGETIPGRVRAVSPGVDPDRRTGLVYADLPAPGPLRAGMFAQGRILLGRAQAPVLPRESVVFRDGYAYVFVARPLEGAASADGLFQVEQRRIEVGDQQGAYAEVRAGVTPGERVVRRGAGFLSDRDVVREAPDQPGPGRESATAAAP